MPFQPYLLVLADRAGRTALQVVAGYLVAGRGQLDWRVIALATALAVVVSVLQGLVDFPAIPGGLIGDVAGRALRTFAQAAVGSIGAAALITDVHWSTILTASVLAAIASVVTSGVATSLGPAAVKGTPDLVSSRLTLGHPYIGYGDIPRHLRTPRHATTALVTTAAAALAFVGIAAVGIVSARNAPLRILAAPAPLPTPAPPSPPLPPDKSPALFAALNHDNIATANDHALLLQVANSVCNARGTATDDQQISQIMAANPNKWTHAQVALIVDDTIASYCG